MSKRRTKNPNPDVPVKDYRHGATRKNIPPAGLAAQGMVREVAKIKFAYDPHRPPVLRSDPTGEADKLPELLETARTRPLTAEEARLLSEALRNREPWLEWAGKREKKEFEVDPVALHIHERVAAQAILKIAARETAQRELFADPQLEYRKAVQFYQHDVDWSNRMILGDSLQVMASLARREDLAGKVQMIYMDPPYGIKFASNFQPEIGKRDVRDKESDLTREPEMVKAYRDTWTLGTHSYLAYLRDRLYLCKELLDDTGSIFVQISDENLHRVRCVMDEVFGQDNFVTLVTFQKAGSTTSELLSNPADYILWYAKQRSATKYKQLYLPKEAGGQGASKYTGVELFDGKRTPSSGGDSRAGSLPARVFRLDAITSQGYRVNTSVPFSFRGKSYDTGTTKNWKTTLDGMARLANADRIERSRETLNYVRFIDDFPAYALTSIWTDIGGIQSRDDPKVYVVQTSTTAIQRCMLMTTEPGDLVLDPSCGSGTTAYVAEQWGRRWITIDTSRVALALARQRLLTATFSMYRIRAADNGNLYEEEVGENSVQSADNPALGFNYKTVPHITLKSIAQNVALDPIFARHQPILDKILASLNAALKTVTPELRKRLASKLLEKEKREGKKSVTDADRRRWMLPRDGWQEWEVPFDTDEDWPEELKTALITYRAAWRAKMDEVNACIAASAEQEDLVDQPEVVRGVVRVSGPFSMEAVMPAAESLDIESPIGGEPEEMETFGPESAQASEPVNAEAYLDKMLRLLRADGVRFPNNKLMTFARLETSNGEFLHADGEWQAEDGKSRTVAVSFGPQFGPVTAYQVENALPVASRRGFEDLVFAGFSFDGAAQAIIQDDPNPRVRCHLAHIRPDVNMGDLLKETPNSQLFTVFGLPRTRLREAEDGLFTIEMEGVDIYNPVDNTILPTSADKIAAWFLDTDYDGQTFCITQAFFPDKSAWDKLARALKGVIDEERFAALSGTVSLPFPAGEKKRVAVKVIDPRGNEVIRVHRLDTKNYDS